MATGKFPFCAAPQKRVAPYTQCTKNTFFENNNITVLSSVLPLTASLTRACCTNLAGTADVVWLSIQFLFPACPGKRQWCPCSLRPVSSNVCLTSLSRTLYKYSCTAASLWRSRILPWKWQSKTEWYVWPGLDYTHARLLLGLTKTHEQCAGHGPLFLKPYCEHFYRRTKTWEESRPLGWHPCAPAVVQEVLSTLQVVTKPKGCIPECQLASLLIKHPSSQPGDTMGRTPRSLCLSPRSSTYWPWGGHSTSVFSSVKWRWWLRIADGCCEAEIRENHLPKHRSWHTVGTQRTLDFFFFFL